MGFSILLSAEVFKHNAAVWYLDGSIGVLIGLTIFAYGVKYDSVFILDHPGYKDALKTPFLSTCLQLGNETNGSRLTPLCARNINDIFAFLGEM